MCVAVQPMRTTSRRLCPAATMVLPRNIETKWGPPQEGGGYRTWISCGIVVSVWLRKLVPVGRDHAPSNNRSGRHA